MSIQHLFGGESSFAFGETGGPVSVEDLKEGMGNLKKIAEELGTSEETAALLYMAEQLDRLSDEINKLLLK